MCVYCKNSNKCVGCGGDMTDVSLEFRTKLKDDIVLLGIIEQQNVCGRCKLEQLERFKAKQQEKQEKEILDFYHNKYVSLQTNDYLIDPSKEFFDNFRQSQQEKIK